MDLQNIDKKTFKAILVENKDLLKEILKEILQENQIIVSEEQAERRSRLESFIKEDFQNYEEVFKALA